MLARGLYIFAAAVVFLNAPCAFADKVKVTEQDGKVRVEIGGKLFTEYHFTNVPRPFCYPIIGPYDLPMTRNWPIKETAGEDQDHPHHRSLWFAHGNVNGVDFWSEQKNFGKQVHENFLKLSSGENSGVIKSQNKWVSAEGKVICRDIRTLRFYGSQSPWSMDFEITLQATEGDVTFGDTKEGTMAVRVAETMRLKPNKFNDGKPTGHILQSTGVRDNETWGKRAEWCDYSGPLRIRTNSIPPGAKEVPAGSYDVAGIAIFDHPSNPRHPTWWHVRDYGLFAANPFGTHDFEKLSDKSAGNFTIPKGKTATFRYRFIFHSGTLSPSALASFYEIFAKNRYSDNESVK